MLFRTVDTLLKNTSTLVGNQQNMYNKNIKKIEKLNFSLNFSIFLIEKLNIFNKEILQEKY